MHARSHLTQRQREQLVDLFDQGIGPTPAADRIGAPRLSSRHLHTHWRLHGRLCLVDKRTKQYLPCETKKLIVDRFLAGETAMDLAAEFGLSSGSLVNAWVRTWRQGGDEALKPKPKGRPKGSTSAGPLSEEDKLRRENDRLRAENAFLKKLRDLREQGHA